ncbi:terminase small subunit [Bombilactobacillus bombi]|uniref:Terminase small subunit n=1 Tax=Bombilactobacillus bombi TaxID=1303590 RepID=A0A417Z842_9LACO|nr:terminase small subunit [Bombilactobacillus bombi]RHW46805.1 terminase small subunit [Bombilactobacillus bombi]
MKKLTVKQQKFADEYIKLGNATKAAIEAGYSKKYTHTNAHKLLQNTAIKEYIDKQLEEIHNSKIADAQEIQEFLTATMRGKTKETVVTQKGDIYEVPVNPKDQLKASELLGKTKAMFTDKKQIDGDLNINVDMGDYDDNN